MIDKVLQTIAPHHCYGCGNVGSLLCDNCKYDINQEPFTGCIACRRPTSAQGMCSDCESLPFGKAWAAGERSDVLKQLIDGYKFNNQYAAAKELAGLLHGCVPILPRDTVIVPVPTISPHIRQRGYDHTELMASRFARTRRLPYRRVLQRKTNSSQRGADSKTRFRQAKEAFETTRQLDGGVPYLLIDDVYTTGATMRFGAQALKDAGAEEVWITVVARQPLD